MYFPFLTSFRSRQRVRSPPLLYKIPDELGNLICCGIQRKMPTIDDVYFCLWHVTAVRLRFGGVERELILTPDHQKAGLFLAHPGLPLGVGVDVGPVIIEEIALNIGLAGLVKKGKLIGPQIRVVALNIGVAADMTRARCRHRQKISAEGTFVGSTIRPKVPPRLPISPQAFVVRDSILDNQSVEPVRMGQGHTKTHGAAVILHVERVARKPECFG